MQAMKEPEDEFIRHSSTGRPLGDTDFIERAEGGIVTSRFKEKIHQGLRWIAIIM